MTRSLFLSCCALALLAGCSADPAQPRAGWFEFPALFSGSEKLSARTAVPPAPALEAWWDGFNDPVLTGLVARALNDNLDLAQAAGRIEQARAMAGLARANMLPSAVVTGGAARNRTSREVTRTADRTNSLFESNFDASWEVDIFGSLRAQRESAMALLAASGYDMAGLRLTVAADVAQTYMTIRALQERLAVNRKTVKTQQELVDLAKLRFDSGFSSELDVAQAQALLASTRSIIPLLETDLAVAKNRLDVLLGDMPGANAALVDPKKPIPALPKMTADITPVDLLRLRPDILSAEHELLSADADVRASVREYYPKVTLGALMGLASLTTGDLFTSSAVQSTLGGNLRWRLFDFGRVDAEIAGAKGRQAELLAAYRQAVLLAVEDVENALVTLVGQERYRRDIERTVGALKRNRDLARSQYQAGETSFIDTLDAERQLYDAEDTLAQAQLNAANALIRSFKAFGGGWVPN